MPDALPTQPAGTALKAPSCAGGAFRNLDRFLHEFDCPKEEPMGTTANGCDADVVRRLTAELAAQSALLREQAHALAHSQKIFERASAAAKIGVWECGLPDETLHWTDQVYDIFDLPRGSSIDRKATLACYSEESRVELTKLRSRAIEERGGFTLDAEIITPKSNRRWVRLTATVECEDGRPVRIFGMKQDITEEKILSDRTRHLAEFDVMTGLANRSRFQASLSALSEGCVDGRRGGALLLIDLDGFKQVNDSFGHAFGDECLKDTGRRLREICQEVELVARIGGDEFAVLTGPDLEPRAVEALADQIVETLHRRVDQDGRSVQLGASVGIAALETSTPSELFTRADTALYAAKAAGRHTSRSFSPDLTHARVPNAGSRRARR